MKYMKYIWISLIVLFSGCDYLDVVPKNDIETIETIFERKADVDYWLKSCYVLLSEPLVSVVAAPDFLGTDEVVAGEFTRQTLAANLGITWNGLFIGDGLQMAQEPYGNVWKKDLFYAGIRYCNIFFENIGKTYNMQESEKQLWTAELKALKAQFYFELMRRYGPIVLVPENIPANVEVAEMQQPRSSIDSCVNVIVGLCNEAMKVLPFLKNKDQSRWSYHSLESVATLKAQVLLYAASPIFNGNPAYAGFVNKQGEALVNTTYDKEKWRLAAEAADSAILLCTQGGKKLISDNITQTSQILNTMLDVENSVLAQNFVNNEAIFMLRHQIAYFELWGRWVLPYFKSDDPDYNSEMYGCISPSMKMVEMYYTEHGLPIDMDKEWDYTSRYQMSKETNPEYRGVVPLQTDVLGLHLRREPRFYAHIAADRCYWQRGKKSEQNVLVEAYQGERFGSKLNVINNSVPQNLSGYWIKKHTYSNVSTYNYGEVYNREEAAVVTRLADLLLMSAEAWNEYLDVPDERVYDPLDQVRERAGIPDVRTAWINYAKNPDKVFTKEGMREIIRQEWNIEFAFEGRRFWNLRRWLTAAEELNDKLYGWNIFGTTAQEFYNNFEGPVVVWSKRRFVAPRDYLFPLRSEEVLISGCVQNPGW